MARPRKPKATEQTKHTSAFLEALVFVGSILKEIGPPNETHILLSNNWAVAFNGILSTGIKIQEDIYACPHSKLIVEALSKCGETQSITQLDNNRLSIKSGKFKAIVPCIDPGLMNITAPDVPVAIINDSLKEGIEAVAVLASETSQKVYGCSILISGQSVITTDNGTMIFEYWHGLDLPPASYNLAIPKSMVQPLIKSGKKLAKLGFSNSSITFYFEDESWIKSQLFSDNWPEVSHILNTKANPFPVPADLWTALDAVAPFSPSGHVYFHSGSLHSHRETGAGASFEVAGLPSGPILSAKQLRLLKPHAETIDFLAPGPSGSYATVFYGKKIRGLITGMSE